MNTTSKKDAAELQGTELANLGEHLTAPMFKVLLDKNYWYLSDPVDKSKVDVYDRYLANPADWRCLYGTVKQETKMQCPITKLHGG